MDDFSDEHEMPAADEPAESIAQRLPVRRFRRVVGWFVDYLIVMIPGLILVILAAAHVVQSLPGFIGAVAADTGWSKIVRLFTSHDAAGLAESAGQEWFWFVLPLLISLISVPLFQFAYLTLLVAWRGRTVGMMIVDATITSGGGRPGAARAAMRAAFVTVAETGLVAAALAVMLLGEFSIGALLWAGAIGLFWIDALAALGKQRRTVGDRITGTVVVRRGLYAVAATRSIAAAQRASAGATSVGRPAASVAGSAGRAAAGATAVAARAVADAAAITGDLVAQGAGSIMESPKVRQVLDSQVAQQVQSVGSAGVERARRLGGRVRRLWDGRRAQRGSESVEPAPLTQHDAMP